MSTVVASPQISSAHASRQSPARFRAEGHSCPRCRSPREKHENTPGYIAEDAELRLKLVPTYGQASSVLLRYRLVGPVGAPVVVVAGGISATRAVCDLPGDTGTGVTPWQPGIVGPARAIDT
ncbi:MAG: hypothetical protein ACRDPW_09330, partial [Mycobacteriales bacterium]